LSFVALVSGLSFVLAAAAGAAEPAPDLSWLSGYWLSCDGGREVAETWSVPRNGHLLGSTVTVRGERVSYELSRIGPGDDGTLRFFAQPSGQAPAEFPLVESGAGSAAFENPSHDFPQRILYRREGDRLRARIEGTIDGASRSVEWIYVAAPFNSRCPES